ncbi:MAG: hypothetical protein ACI89J_004173, partial [Hyphomicrobiaceae bacterium]
MSAKTMEHGAAPASGDGGSAFFSCRGLQSDYGDSYIVQ